jgi:hypothetical protein
MNEIRKGDVLKSRDGQGAIVLKVLGEGHIQSTNGVSIQANGSGKSSSRFDVYNGLFLNRISSDELGVIYGEVVGNIRETPSLIDLIV